MPDVRRSLTPGPARNPVAQDQGSTAPRVPESCGDMAKKFPLNPPHPERNCWGCDKYCPAGSLVCGNGSERTQHPAELFGDDWAETGLDPFAGSEATATHPERR